MELIRPFGKLNKDNADLAGGKGASLGEMTQAGIPVPPGFVVLSASFERFLEETDLNVEIDAILHKVNHKEIHTVDSASESIRELILNAEMPKDIADEIDHEFKILNTQYVAVRSSATAEDGKDHAWAGQLESYLNTTEDDVLNKVKLCWSSLFTPRAIFYRFEKGLHTTKISVAVVIQKMVESEVSGIAFSVHPVTEDYNQLIIEAGFGLGEAIVSGSVTPDSYVVSKEPRAILDINISTQDRALYRSDTVSLEHGRNEWRTIPEPRASSQVFSESQILELSEIILRIENHYGFPCDIEWAYEGGKFYVVQSRPITTLAPKEKTEFISLELLNFPRKDYQFLGLYKSDLFPAYFWTHWFKKEIIKELGFSIPFSGCVSLKGGHFSYHKEVLKWGLEEMNTMIADKTGKRIRKFREAAEKEFKKLLATADSFSGLEQSAENFRHVTEACEDMMPYWVLSNLIGAGFDSVIAEKAVEEGVPAVDVADIIPRFPTQVDNQHVDAKRLLGLLKRKSLDTFLGSDVQKVVAEINADKELKKEFDEHINKFGWIELINFIGTPLSLDRLLSQLRTAAESVSHAHEHKDNTEKLSQEFTHVLNVAAGVGFVRQGAAESSSIFHYKLIRFFEKIAEKLGLEYREMLNLVPPEIIEGLNGVKSQKQLKEIALGRSNYNWVVYSDVKTEELIVVDNKQDVDTLQKFMVPVVGENINILPGQIGNKGKIRGRVSVILATDDFPKFVEGSVLVTTMTTPDFVILMQKSIGIVTDIGGMLSHASIVSRELKKPCVIGTKFATQVLKDGDLVEVDADNGVVRILEKGEEVADN